MEIFGTKTFTLETDVKMQAFKICEEAFEVYQEAKYLAVNHDFITPEARLWNLRAEMADVIQSVVNLADMLGLTEEEVLDDMNECYRRNANRGRVE